MNVFIYSFFIGVYNLVAHLLSPFSRKASQFTTGRKGIFRKAAAEISNNSPVAWFHCASLGEFEQGRPLIEAFKKNHADYKIVLTFFSPSGYENRKKYGQADYIYYLPLDTKKNADKWIQLVQPAIAFFVKYEFWHFYAQALKRNNIPLFSVCSIFRKEQVFFSMVWEI